jgi:hypothetical protein
MRGDAPESAPRGEPGGERCPYCAEPIAGNEARCPHCKADLEGEEDERPWERRGGVRRDGEPHRGTMVLVFGILSIVFGAVVPAGACCGPLAVAGFVGLGMGIAAWVMGRRDLAKIDAGTMDPRGRGSTKAGKICGIIGTLVSSLMILLLLGLVVFYVVFMIVSSQQGKSPF